MTQFRRYLGLGVLVFLPLAPAMAAQAPHAHAGSMDVYASVVPAPIIGGHLARHPQHGIRARPGNDASLLVVALFDHRTGQRISVVHVTARLQHGLRSPGSVDLEPIRIDNQLAFGNYVRFPATGRYAITISVERPSAKGGDYARLPYWQP